MPSQKTNVAYRNSVPPNTVVAPGSEALIGGKYTVYGLQGRSVLLLIAK